MRRALGTGFIAGFIIAVVALLILRPANDRQRPPPAAAEDFAAPGVSSGRAALACRADLLAQASTLEIEATDLRLPDSFRERILNGTELLHQTWGQWLDDDGLLSPPVRLRFVADVNRFAELYEGPVPENTDTSGFYRMRENEAVVLYSPYRRHDTLATTLHELSHLFTAWHLGTTPAWLNEGLAEHFETLDSRGEFRISAEHVVVLRRDGPTPFDRLLRLKQAEFVQKDARQRYASAWALVTFLLESEGGLSALQELLQEVHAQRCDTSRPRLLALGAYPGGAEQLEQDWNAWVRRL